MSEEESSNGSSEELPPAAAGGQAGPRATVGAVLLFVALAVALLVATGGYFSPGERAAFFVLTALVTGLTFWHFTGSTGLYTRPGMRLGGAAAIGAIFMVTAAALTRDSGDNTLIVTLPPRPDATRYFLGSPVSIGASTVWDLGGGRVLVEFGEDIPEVIFSVGWLTAGEVLDTSYRVGRDDPVATEVMQ